MAYRPSKRSSRSIEPLEINIFPMMNLMVVLVPLLLSTATAIKLGVIEINLPQATVGTDGEAQMPVEATKSLDLTVTITSQGLYLSSSQAVLHDEDGSTLPIMDDGSYDFVKLSSMLFEVKRQIINGPLDTKGIILQAEPNIEYQAIVSTMDACRVAPTENGVIELFPNVSVSSGIFNIE
jgi:biopolymer transport protein ExbD